MKNRIVAMIIAAAVVVGAGAGVGGAITYEKMTKGAQTTEVTATVENASCENDTVDEQLPDIIKALNEA